MSTTDPKAVDLANYRKFRELRQTNPFQAAQLLEEIGSAALERGRAEEEQPEPPPAAA